MTLLVPTDMNRCTVCECPIHDTQHFGLSVVSANAAIGYVLCEACGPKGPSGLEAAALQKLNAKLDEIALAHGLTVTH